MASYNRVVIAGNLTRDVEMRATPGGSSVADVGIAVNEKRKDKGGEWIEEVNFFDVTMWGRTAEVASEYLAKGSNVLIEGRLKFEQWEKDGEKRSKVKIVCDRLVMLGNKNDSQGGSGSGKENSNYSNANASTDDDAPF